MVSAIRILILVLYFIMVRYAYSDDQNSNISSVSTTINDDNYQKYLKYKKLEDKYRIMAEHYHKLSVDNKANTSSTNSGSSSSVKLNKISRSNNKSSVDNYKAIKEPWKGSSFGLGGSMTTGNSQTENLNVATNIKYNPIKRWENTLLFNYLYSIDTSDGSDSEVTVNNIKIDAKTSWDFSKENAIYGSVNYLKDEVGSYSNNWIESVGYQRNLYKTSNLNLNATLGPSLNQSQLQSDNDWSHGIGLQTTLNFSWNFSKNNSFAEKILTNYSYQDKAPNNLAYQSNSILSFKIYKNLNLQLQFQVNGNTWVEPGSKRVDTVTSTSITYIL